MRLRTPTSGSKDASVGFEGGQRRTTVAKWLAGALRIRRVTPVGQAAPASVPSAPPVRHRHWHTGSAQLTAFSGYHNQSLSLIRRWPTSDQGCQHVHMGGL